VLLIYRLIPRMSGFLEWIVIFWYHSSQSLLGGFS
jgi:hypothetical protein